MRISNFASPSLVHSLLLPLSLSLLSALHSSCCFYLCLPSSLMVLFFRFLVAFLLWQLSRLFGHWHFHYICFFFFLGNREKSLLYFVVLFLVRKCACSSLSTFLGCFRIVSCFFFFLLPQTPKGTWVLAWVSSNRVYMYILPNQTSELINGCKKRMRTGLNLLPLPVLFYMIFRIK